MAHGKNDIKQHSGSDQISRLESEPPPACVSVSSPLHSRAGTTWDKGRGLGILAEQRDGLRLSTGLLNTAPTFPGSAQVHSSESHQELLLVTGDSKVGGRAGVTQVTCVPFALALTSQTVGENPLVGLPCWHSEESTCQCRRHGFSSWSRKMPHALEQLNLWATTTEPALYSPRTATACKPVHLESALHNKRSHCTEEPAHHRERAASACSN